VYVVVCCLSTIPLSLLVVVVVLKVVVHGTSALGILRLVFSLE